MNKEMKNIEKFVSKDKMIVSKADVSGRIKYVNQEFINISGYEEIEVIGKQHNIIRHPDMPKLIFKHLWDTLAKREEVFAYVKNRCKDGEYYWVFANVTPSIVNNKLVGYHSSRRRPNLDLVKNKIIPLYDRLLKAEKVGGINQSQKLFEQILKEKDLSYEEFILSL